jgi:hypothetical protein
MGFSQRMGLQPLTKDIQIDSIDQDLKNGLWNIIKIRLLDKISRKQGYGTDNDFDPFCKYVWHHYYKLPIDTIPNYQHLCETFIRDKFFNYDWHEIYDFLEFLMNLKVTNFNREKFLSEINILLEQEFSGYRIIDGLVCPITNEIEINEIEEAKNQFTPSSGANIHLKNALDKLSDKKNPDYGNSIKESISALESVIRLLTGESTLGKGLSALSSKGIEIDPLIKSGMEKFYGFTNNKGSGIRHAIVEDYQSPDFDDAKLMIVLCSSFINFLMSKSKALAVSPI